MESVGRNSYDITGGVDFMGSLSAWRAWVEMGQYLCSGCACSVALRMESVGRNYSTQSELSGKTVALRMESVGRNPPLLVLALKVHGRSPHGERG